MLQGLFSNVVVQILLGIGAMVFLITLGETLRSAYTNKGSKTSKETEMKIRADIQKDLAALREEIANLKETVLEHSMSLDNNVENLKNRLEHIERRG